MRLNALIERRDRRKCADTFSFFFLRSECYSFKKNLVLYGYTKVDLF